MIQDNFQQRKKDILSKLDKSSIGEWDEKIVQLCEKINSFPSLYTTSSCSGRIMILKDEDKKAPGLFKFVSHDLVRFEDFIKNIPEKGDYKFKQEPLILHIACESLRDAEKLLEKSKIAGLKRSGIISLSKNIIIEIISTEKLEFPLVKKGKLLVDDEFLRVVLEKSNKNLEKSWQKIDKFLKLL